MNSAPTIFVTGASGHLGRRLLPRLLSLGYQVRGQFRNRKKAEKFLSSAIELVEGDIRNPGWLPEALSGCDYLIHSAAMVSLRPAKSEDMRSINVDGTRNVVEAARQAGIKRLVHISSVAAVGGSIDGVPLDENANFNLAGFGLLYFETKHEAEKLALEASGSGMEVVTVNPSIIIYPPERKVTKDDLKKIPRFLPFYFDFGLNLVHADDVIEGIIAALEKGRNGERYILAGDNIDAPRLFAAAKKYFGIGKPLLKLPLPCLYPIGLAGEIFHRARHFGSLHGKGPRINRGMARLAGLRFFYDISKARRELGYNPRTMETLLEEILKDLN